MTTPAFQHLETLFRRSDLLPQLPEPAMRLIRLMEHGDPKADELEAVVSTDPALVASLIRVASSSIYAGYAPVTTIPGAILRLGYTAIRTLAISFTLQAMVSRPARRCAFDPRRFARHSLFVAYLAQEAVRDAQTQAGAPSSASDEAFAAGMIHDIAVALLSRVAPDAFDRVAARGKREGLGFATSFQRTYSGRLGDLGRIAAQAWQLPPLFVGAIQLCSPDGADGIPFGPTLVWADEIARGCGCVHERWEVRDRRELTPDETEIAEAVSKLVDEFLPAFGEAA